MTKFNRCVLAQALIAAGISTASAQPLEAQPTVSASPSIVLIMTDDQRADDLSNMPQTRNLIGAQGTTFQHSFVSFALCCPSRSTFMTGQYSHNHGVQGNPPVASLLDLDQSNLLPVWLQEAGYRTAHVGEYVNGYALGQGVPPGWNDWQGLPTGSKMVGFNLSDNGRTVRYGSTAYQTDVIADRSVQTLNELAVQNQPFYLNIWVHAAHLEMNVPGFPNPRVAQRHLSRLSSFTLPRPPSFGKHFTAAQIKAISNRYKSRQGTLLAVDELVSRVVSTLQSTGQLDNTVIIFTSDNGWIQGEHNIATGKTQAYEESIGVPLMIRGPGFPAGKTVSQVVGNQDLSPTILELTGARPRRTQDGQSLLPIAADPAIANDRKLILETKGYVGVRTNDFKYVKYNTGLEQLFELRADPYELTNQAKSASFAAVKRQLIADVARLRNCKGTTCQ